MLNPPDIGSIERAAGGEEGANLEGEAGGDDRDDRVDNHGVEAEDLNDEVEAERGELASDHADENEPEDPNERGERASDHADENETEDPNDGVEAERRERASDHVENEPEVKKRKVSKEVRDLDEKNILPGKRVRKQTTPFQHYFSNFRSLDPQAPKKPKAPKKQKRIVRK